MNTPHINAEKDDFAKTVLMPGDPKRSEFIAKNFLSSAKLVNNVRGVEGYTGEYNGVRISVMASGMGMPSIGIYSHELYNFFDVENIIRIGSAGAIQENIKLRDIVIAQGACTNSRFSHQFELPGDFAPIADFSLLLTCANTAKEKNIPYHIGNILSSDTFYGDEEGLPSYMTSTEKWKKMGVMAIEMEAAALYITAARYNKKALAICTVSDHLITKEETTAEERQNSLTQMIELALLTAVKTEEGESE